jgi:hypothetical protein
MADERKPEKTVRTPEEQEILDLVAQGEGREWTEAHAESILDEARDIGHLPWPDDSDEQEE